MFLARSELRAGTGDFIMTSRIWAALPRSRDWLAGSAHAATINFSFGGEETSAVSRNHHHRPGPVRRYDGHFWNAQPNRRPSAGPPPNYQGMVDPANALAVTGSLVPFSDAALGIADVDDHGLAPHEPQPTSTD